MKLSSLHAELFSGVHGEPLKPIAFKHDGAVASMTASSRIPAQSGSHLSDFAKLYLHPLQILADQLHICGGQEFIL